MTEVAWTKDELKEALDGNDLPVLNLIILFFSYGKCLVTKVIKVPILNSTNYSSEAPAVPDLSWCWWMLMPLQLSSSF